MLSSTGTAADERAGRGAALTETALVQQPTLEEELRARARQQAVVAQLGHRALTGAALGALLDDAVAGVVDTLHVEYCTVLELLPDGAALLLREQAARAAVEAAAERSARLQAVTAALSEAVTPARVAGVIIEQGLAALDARVVVIALLADDGGALEVAGAAGLPQALQEEWSRFPLDAPLPLADSVRMGEAMFLESRADRATHYPHLARVNIATGTGALVALPLVIEGRPLGALGLSFADERHFSEDDRTFLLALAHQCAQSLERARLQETERAAQADAEAGRRLRFLAESSAVLATSLDYEATLAGVARLAVPSLADACIVDIVGEDGRIRRLAAEHGDPAKEPLLHELQRRYPPDPGGPHAVAVAIRTGQTVAYPEVSDAHLLAIAQDAEHLHLLRELGPTSFVALPLVARGRTLGAIWLLSTTVGRCYSQTDIALAEELAHRAALAVDNARLYDAAQRAVRVREEFLAMTSHELRTPLSHIKGLVSTLRQPDVAWDAETQQDFLAEAEGEADRLDRLVSDLLDLSRIESGGLERSDRAPTRLTDLVAAALDRLRRVVSDRSLLVAIPSELPVALLDASQLEHVVGNLVDNAVKYSRPQSTIRLAGARVGDELELRVEDEGPGIPPEDLARVFEKFYRAHRSVRTGIPGTGLGLAICRGIVQEHGGRIWAENRADGRGACFVVRLPVARGATGEIA